MRRSASSRAIAKRRASWSTRHAFPARSRTARTRIPAGRHPSMLTPPCPITTTCARDARSSTRFRTPSTITVSGCSHIIVIGIIALAAARSAMSCWPTEGGRSMRSAMKSGGSPSRLDSSVMIARSSRSVAPSADATASPTDKPPAPSSREMLTITISVFPPGAASNLWPATPIFDLLADKEGMLERSPRVAVSGPEDVCAWLREVERTRDLTLPLADESAEAAAARRFVDALRDEMASFREIVEGAAEAAALNAKQLEAIAGATAEHSAVVEQTAAAIAEIDRGAAHVADTAEALRTQAATMADSTSRYDAGIDEVLSRLEAVAAAVEGAAAFASAMESGSGEISAFLD